MFNLAKAKGFHDTNNYAQLLRYSDLAVTKLKKLKNHPIEDIDAALNYKFSALHHMDRNSEALECAKEWYCLYLTKHTHPPAIIAGFALIESCIHNNQFFDAVLYARTTWETLTLSRDSHIPEGQQQWFTAKGAYQLANAILHFSMDEDIPLEKQQESRREAIMLARKAMEIHTQMHGAESADVADDILLLAQILHYFNDDDDDEVPHLYKQAKVIFARVQGSLSVNVAASEGSLGGAYYSRATRAQAAQDADRFIVNLELALPHYREAARIYRAINHVERADSAVRNVSDLENLLQKVTLARAATANL